VRLEGPGAGAAAAAGDEAAGAVVEETALAAEGTTTAAVTGAGAAVLSTRVPQAPVTMPAVSTAIRSRAWWRTVGRMGCYLPLGNPDQQDRTLAIRLELD
jgi:hypothetical protein